PSGSFSVRVLSVMLVRRSVLAANDASGAVKKRIGQSLLANGRVHAVARVDDGFQRKSGYFLESCRQLRRVGKRKVGATDGAGEQTIAHQRHAIAVNDDVTRCMPRRVHHSHLTVANFDALTL